MRLPRIMAFALPMGLLLGGCASNFDLQGHRGTRGLMPENTLPAFAKALEIGVTTLELDTNVTRDGVVVIAHDSVLNADLARLPDGKWLETRMDKGVSEAAKAPSIYSLSFDELQRYDVGRIKPGTKYAERHPEQQSIEGTRIPKLADLFALVEKSGNKRVRFNIETKLSPFERDATPGPQAFVDALLDVITRAGMRSRVTIQSFDWRTLKISQQQAPDIPTVYLSAQQKFLDTINANGREGSAWTAGLNVREFGGSVPRMVKAAGGTIWSPYFADVDQARVQEAQGLGLKVVVWTVNQPADIERMLDWKVNGIISDYPNRVREVMQKRGMKLPG
ncbi:MAG: glycerophosphodiester phosphodiesterase [Usitatibacteraceae bacterium]